MWLVAGLGNPGEKYAKTRHNVGFMVVDELASRLGQTFQKNFKGEAVKAELSGNSVLLLKPQTFMNLSGESVLAACQFHKIRPDCVIAVHDELDIPFGEVRVKFDGGPGGHNGIRDIIRVLGTQFIRVRVGVGRPAIKGMEADFVLKEYRKDELLNLPQQIEKACDAVSIIVKEGLKKAQMVCNQKQSPLAK